MTDQPTPEPDFDQETVTKFWSKVDKTEACWTWTGSIDQHGYGYFRTNGRRYAAHRFSYLLARGDIPKGLVVDHLCHGWDTNCKAEGNWCRHRSCVNPDHLEAVTQRENLLRGHGVSGQAARRTHCPQGHPYDEANTYFQGGDRRCRACREARKAAARIVPPSAERTHCPQGHPYDEENTYRRPSGHRSCRTCRSEQARRSRQGQPARRKAQTLPPPADRAAILREAADFAADFNSDCQSCAVELEVANGLRRLAAEAQQPDTETHDDIQVWPLQRVLTQVQCGSQDWTWDEEWADLDRRHAETGYLDKLEQQIRQNGITMPVLVGSDGRLWDGHHRLRIAVRLGIDYVPVEVTPPAHIGGNADDCPACQAQGLHTIGHPYECPGPETAAGGGRTD